jgi:hypothetical protein
MISNIREFFAQMCKAEGKPRWNTSSWSSRQPGRYSFFPPTGSFNGFIDALPNFGGSAAAPSYGVLCLNQHDRVIHAAAFDGLTVFSQLRALPQLEGMRLDAILATATPPDGVRSAQWKALQHAAQFFTTQPNANDVPSTQTT